MREGESKLEYPEKTWRSACPAVTHVERNACFTRWNLNPRPNDLHCTGEDKGPCIIVPGDSAP